MAGKARAGGPRRTTNSERTISRSHGGQIRRAGAKNWTKDKEARFLTALAETCNVTLSASEAGVSVGGAYKRRKSHAAFRAAWLEAIAMAYRRLELVLLERTFNGTDKVVTRRDGSEDRVREYPNNIGLALLKMHKETVIEAEREFAPAEVEEMREKLRRKLNRLRQRLIDEGKLKE